MNEQDCWKYLLWDAETKQCKANKEIPPLSHSRAMEHIKRLQELFPQPNVVHRLHSLRPLTENPDAPMITMSWTSVSEHRRLKRPTQSCAH